jgi:hypothetical protein
MADKCDPDRASVQTLNQVPGTYLRVS